MKKVILIIVIIIFIILGYIAYLGVFNSVEFTEKEIGPFTFVYEENIGDYAKTGPVFDKIYEDLTADDIETSKGFGIYYDDPKVAPKEQLRSKVGSIITEEQEKEIDERGLPYKIMTIDPITAIVTDIPYRNTLSIFVGVMKVYPKLSEYLEANGYKGALTYELYDKENGKIVYMMEIVK